MQVHLAGFNVDRNAMLAATASDATKATFEALSPESLVAAYGQISRAQGTIEALRVHAAKDMAATRAFNQKVIYQYGHDSVAEHAVFNFDITGISRLALEYLEQARLCSYTERSMRYTLIDEKAFDIVQPLGLHAHPALRDEFTDAMQTCLDAYYALLKLGDISPEDARYVTPLALMSQVGFTCNARQLQYMIRRFLDTPLPEVVELGTQLRAEAVAVAPSLFKEDVCERSCEFSTQLPDVTGHHVAVHVATPTATPGVLSLLAGPPAEGSAVSSGDLVILAALAHQAGQASFSVCHHMVSTMSLAQAKAFMRDIVTKMDVYSAAPRCFELCDLVVEGVVSASCFAQLKRHRMMTLIPQGYDVSLGCMLPASIAAKPEAVSRFRAVMDVTQQIAAQMVRRGLVAQSAYALTKAHKRRVLVKMNARELYAFSRLREDHHAQWEIREWANYLLGCARHVMPLTMMLACGRDVFEEWKARLLA